MATETRPSSGSPGRRRLSADDRRTQLLDVATRLLAEEGPEAVTMERVAARAGVSKSLGYRHFDNADELLIALYEREMSDLRRRVGAAIDGAVGFEDELRAALAALLDLLTERGTVVAGIIHTRPAPGPVDARSRAFHAEVSEFFGSLAVDAYGLTPATAYAAASILLSGIDGLIDRWVNHRMTRRELIDIYTTMCVASLEALSVQPPLIGEPTSGPSPIRRTRPRGP
jgi:AcrR family transcriptional regulator